MSSEQAVNVSEQMVDEGLLVTVDAGSVTRFLAGDGPRLLFFAGSKSVRREAHDVAVALRELLRDYRGSLGAALVEPAAESALQSRFRVPATPCLVLLAGGEILEVLPRVRDWSDYLSLFQRYLGAPPARQGTVETAA